MGGGHALWVFENGKLIVLQTFKAGAFKATIAFSRRAEGFGCTIHSGFARETGVAAFEWNWTSPIVGGDIRMKSIKPVSSSCQVTR
jgi:hypothetical protein